MYDHVIIGAGPCGLTLAYYLAKYNKKVLLIDRQGTIGGCHRVRRVNNYFTEHGPRIYLHNYFSLIDVLSDMGRSFDDLFTPYNFSMLGSIGSTSSKFLFKERMAMAYEFIKFMINEQPSHNMTMLEFAKSYGFTDESIKMVDNLCKLTDGGTINNYTLYEFNQILNQNVLYGIFQPKKPNDVGLFKIWEDALNKTGNVELMLNTEIDKIISSDKADMVVTKNGKQIQASTFIFAIPPKFMMPIIKSSTNINMFGEYNDLNRWAINTAYLIYIPIVFHWNIKLQLEQIVPFPSSDYGLVHVILSDYMDFANPNSLTVIVCTVKNADQKSSYNGKTANECNEKELIDEVFRQLKLIRPNLPAPMVSLLSPEMFKNKETGNWDSTDSAFFYTKDGYRPNSSVYNNLFWVGTHNGASDYSFTSFQSAQENAIALLHQLEPNSKDKVLLHEPKTIRWSLAMTILLILAVVIYKLWR